MTPLERRYRKLLRRLPASYRRRWEDDMVATYLAATVPDDPEEADHVEQCGRPTREERLSILRLAVRLRLGGVGDPPHAQAWGDAVRRLALVGLLANSIVAIGAVWRMIVPRPADWFPLPVAIADAGAGPLGAWIVAVDVTLGLLWIAAFIALVLGHRRIAAIAGALAFLPSAIDLASTLGGLLDAGLRGFLLSQVAMAIAVGLPLLALAAFHAEAPPLRREPWLLAGVGTAALAVLPAYVSLLPTVYFADRPAWWAIAIVVAGVAHLMRRRHGRGDPRWTLTLAVLAGIVLAVRLVTLLDVALVLGGSGLGGLLLVGVVQAVAVAAVARPLWSRAAADLRSLPLADGQAAPPPPAVRASGAS